MFTVSTVCTGTEGMKRKPSFASTPGGNAVLTKLIRDHHLVAMVVDDTLTIRKLMEKMLLKLGFDRVDCYENGKKGLEALLAAPVDIVFSDVQMPIMTGPEVCFQNAFLVHFKYMCSPYSCIVLFLIQMVRRFRLEEASLLQQGLRDARQLIVAVSANLETLGDGFDYSCPKPLNKNDLANIVMGYLSNKVAHQV